MNSINVEVLDILFFLFFPGIFCSTPCVCHCTLNRCSEPSHRDTLLPPVTIMSPSHFRKSRLPLNIFHTHSIFTFPCWRERFQIMTENCAHSCHPAGNKSHLRGHLCPGQLLLGKAARLYGRGCVTWTLWSQAGIWEQDAPGQLFNLPKPWFAPL